MSGRTRMTMACWVGLVFIMAGCGSGPVRPPVGESSGGPPRVVLTVGEISGSDGALVAGLLKQSLARIQGLPAAGESAATQVIGGEVLVEVRDESGRDLVREKVPTGQTETRTVKDFFTKRDFTVKEPVLEERVKEVPYVFRAASLTLKYSLGPAPSGAPDGNSDSGTITARFDQKYGGINEGSRLGFNLAELPAREATLAVLADRLADRLTSLTPAGAARFPALLQRGHGLFREPGIDDGVRAAEAGNWDQAEGHWAKVLERDKDNAVALYNMGVAFERRGGRNNLSKAYDYFTRASIQVDDKAYRAAVTRVLIRMKE